MTRSVLPQRTQDDEASSSDRTSSPEVRVPKKRVRRSLRFDLFTALLARHERAENSGQSFIMTRAMKKLREQNQRRRAALNNPDDDSASTSADPESCNTSVEVVGKRGDKRKVAAAEKGRNRRKEQTRKKQQRNNKEAFETKYEELDFISGGGCGSVYAGFRRADDLPVAIKHILNEMILITHDDEEGNVISIEVAIMQKLAEEGPSAHVTLLDWYQLEKDLVLVMERPMPAEDFHDYLRELGGCIKEDEAKIILRQLVDAALDLESKNIFHRDIKLENILIETSSDVPRVRIIDFGLSCFDERKETYPEFCGTLLTPEFYCEKGFKAGPTTVYQIGAVLYNALHSKEFFDTIKFNSKAQFLPRRISKNCRNFLQMCLRVDPAHRPTLEQLRNHQWLE